MLKSQGKGSVLISAFSRASGLSVDTVRLYVRRGLLLPATGSRGGRNPYQVFSERDLRAAELIRLGQALGLTLAEIGRLLADEQAGRIDRERSLEILTEQRDRLAGKVRELTRLVQYLDAKIESVSGGSAEPSPRISDFADRPHSSRK